MRYEIGFGVGFTADGQAIDPVDRQEWIKLVLVEACNRFGGCHISFGQGAWINPAGSLVVEESAVLTVMNLPSTDRLYVDNGELALQLAERIRVIFQQQAVLLTKIVGTTALLAEVDHASR